MIPRNRVREALGTTAAKNAPRTLESMLAMNDRAIKMVMAPERLEAKASSPVKICAGTVQSEHSGQPITRVADKPGNRRC